MTDRQLIQGVKGTRDFYPEDWAFEMWFYEKIKEVSQLFGFQEYEGPLLETLALYAAKSGEELVKKQAFTLQDRSGETLALRSEMTPSLARMVAQKSGELIFPVKWFTFGRRFRYEKPQKGRGREFFQWDCDTLGLDSPEADAEIIAIAATMYQKLGLTPQEVRIKVNDRQLMQKKLISLELDEEAIVKAFRLIDKKDKVNREDFLEMAKEQGFTADQALAMIQVTEEKNAYLDSPSLIKIFEILKRYGVADYIEFDPGIVRGLEYYTGTVFEGWDVKGEFRAIWGGGRYGNLTAEVGGKEKIPGVGFAMGDMVIAEILKANGKYPTLPQTTTKLLVTIFSLELLDQSINLTNELRKNNINTELYLDPQTKLDKQIKYADKKSIPWVTILGPNEVQKNTVTLKNLETGEQKTISQEQLLNELKQNSN
ncbi:MAG: histidine--tRNA ligase [Patescibacteria group bacterium]|nr:histidine--tRNA ligase [Patescibacteria group bacterium]